ncbi:MAG: hypothetical protein ACFFCO_10700, partial [Promethearchaeota archaeon]
TVTPASQLSTTIREVSLPGSFLYYDDLTTTTYRDAGNTTASGWGTGKIYNPRAGSPTYLDSVNPPNADVYTVELQGRKLYVSTYHASASTGTFTIYDVSDPTNIQSLGGYDISDQLISGEIDGDLYFSGDYESYVRIFNVSNPTSVSFVDSLYFGGEPVTDIEIQGRHMYVALYGNPGDLRIYDIEDQTDPYFTDSETWWNLRGLAVEGDKVYAVGGTTNGLWIHNVSNSYDIDTIGYETFAGYALDVVVDGDIAYVADGTSGVYAVDCSDLTNPTVIDTFDTIGNATDVELQGDTLVVADGSSGVCYFLDVSDPTDIRSVYTLGFAYAVHDVSIHDGLLAIGTSSFVYLYSLGDLAGLPLYSTYSTYDALDVDVQGDIAYVAAGTDGLVVLDVSDKVNPVLLDVVKHTSSVYYTSVDVQGIHCFVTNDATVIGLYCFDVSDPTNVVYLDFQSRGSGYDVVIAGDTAFHANGAHAGSIVMINVSDPWNFGTTLDYDGTIYNCTTVAVQGHYAFAGGTGVSSSDHGVVGYNINNLTEIQIADQITYVDVYDIDVSGDIMAVANGDWGVNICNISDPWNMVNVDGISYGGLPFTSVEIFGNYFFAGRTGTGIYLFDATDPTNLQQAALYSGASDVRSLHIDGDFLYVANGNSLQIRRVFNSLGDTWDTTTRYAQSLEVDTTDRTIENATLTCAIGIDFGISGATVGWQLSADGGAHWESVTGGSPHTFTNKGHKLLWRATLITSYNDRTPYIAWAQIDYEYNDLPTAPTLTDPGTTDTDGNFTVSWSASTDASGVVASYQLQMDTSNTFAAPTSYVVTTTSREFTGLTNNTYYFRVRAIDDDDEAGPWSSTENIEVAIPAPATTPPPDLTPLIIGVIIVVIVVVIVIVLLLLYFLYFKKKK